MEYIAGYSKGTSSLHKVPADADLFCVTALANDVTARNLQDEVKRKSLPWSAAKGFDTFTPIG